MISDPLVRTTALLILCALPAAMRGWSARLLIPLRDDPVLPERLAAHRRRNLIGLWFAIVAIFVVGGVRELLWTLPLVLIGRLVAGYPIRRALYDERWSFATYAATMLRLWLAVAGFWLFLAAAPLIAGSAGSLDWLVALLLRLLSFAVEPTLCRGVSLARTVATAPRRAAAFSVSDNGRREPGTAAAIRAG